MARTRTLIKPKRKPKIVEKTNVALEAMARAARIAIENTDTDGWKPYIPPRSGHPRFYELTALEEDLHSRKNKDYAAGGTSLGNFERVSKFLSMYPGLSLSAPHVVAVVFMMKQLDAALWLMSTIREGEIEGVAERLGDIGVYAKIIRILYEESQK